jgi:hypothetical protein
MPLFSGRRWVESTVLVGLFGMLLLFPLSWANAAEAGTADSGARIRIERGHPWRPPFGLDRVGQPLTAVVEISAAQQPSAEYSVVGYLRGKETARATLTLSGQAPATGRVSFDPWPTELVLAVKPAQGAAVELVRQTVEPVPFEAEAVARPDRIIHPVDLGAILVPSDWLILADGQQGSIDVAAICRSGDVPDARVAAWFESAPAEKTAVEAALVQDRRFQARLPLPPTPVNLDRDVLHVSIEPGNGARLWHKAISTMLVHRRPQWPEFGAAETKLRYDAPISVRADDGTFSSLSYAEAWDSKLQDVVVSLPNGSRFVFWRGSSYVPFWAGRHNTGLSYEWAETSPPPDGFTDCVEPLMDKELRYGRVRIVESTPARIHVRWSYQSCDFKYKVWGDSAVEDYYFYRDGFGTRVLTLQSVPTGDYELSEFIILTPQATYPFNVLPPNLVDILFVDGQKRELAFPFVVAVQGDKIKSREQAAIYRVRLHKDDPLPAIYFNPLDIHLPQAVFGPFSDQGQIVTPCYWGSHWPLGRGKTTGWAIDDRVQFTPCHNSVMSWARSRPKPLRTAQLETLDTLGNSKPMVVQTWIWLIGMSDADDGRLVEWARSFAKPPTLEVRGGRLEAESYVPERRAIRLVVEEPTVVIEIKPIGACVNPVFELAGAPATLTEVALGSRSLDAKDYAWDGQTLWINTTLTQATQLRLAFDGRPVQKPSP